MLLTLLAAVLGTALFVVLQLPLPFLFGPMAACLCCALAGVRLGGLGVLSIGARTVLGVAVGASISPAFFAQLSSVIASIALVPLFVVLIGVVGVPYFRRGWKFDPVTAYYAAMPGGLQDMVAFGAEAGADVRALTLIHATRVLIIVTLAPAVMSWVYGATLANPIGASASDIPPEALALMVAAALVGWKGAERIGLFGAAILGPIAVTAALSLFGLIEHRPPSEAILAAQFFIGAGIGASFVGVTLSELKRAVAAGVGYVFVLAALAFAFASVVATLGVGPSLEAFLAFAPGGQAEMTVLAIVTGADLGYVVSHHLVRLVLVIAGAPVAAALIRRARPPD